MNCLLLLLSLCMCCLFSACHKKKEEETTPATAVYWQQYLLQFQKTDNGTIAQATFRQNDSTGSHIELRGNEDVTFNGEQEWSYEHYIYEWGKPGAVDVHFLLTGNDHNTFGNTIQIADTSDIDIPSSFTAVSRSSATLFTWTGRPLSSTEEVSVFFQNYTTTSDTVRIRQAGASSLSLTNTLSFFSTTDADMYVIRRKVLPLTQPDGHAGGNRIVEVQVRKKITLNP